MKHLILIPYLLFAIPILIYILVFELWPRRAQVIEFFKDYRRMWHTITLLFTDDV